MFLILTITIQLIYIYIQIVFSLNSFKTNIIFDNFCYYQKK